MQLLSSIKKVNILIACLLVLTSCTQIGDKAHPIYQLNSWIFPLLTTIGAVIYGYQAYREKKQFKGRVAIYVFGHFWFSFAFTIATIIIIWNLLNNI
jgi:hypothetical protein